MNSKYFLHEVTFIMPPASDEELSAIIIYCLSWQKYSFSFAR